MKNFIPVMVLILLITTSFVGVSNKIGENNNYKENKVQITENIFEKSKVTLWSLANKNFCPTSNCPRSKNKNHNNFNDFNVKSEFQDCDHYAYISTGNSDPLLCWIYRFKLSGGDFDCVCYGPGVSIEFLTSGAWTNDHRLLVVGYDDGRLYELDLDSCHLIAIGGGGVGLNGLTFDPIDQQLYGCSSNNLYKIDSATGEQDLVGPFNTGQTMIEIACDEDGVMYGWDVKFSGNSILYTIDKYTGEATAVGSMGMTLCYAQSGDFCRKCDILYLAAYIISPYWGSYFVECDEDTGECEILGAMSQNFESFFVIPDVNELPIAMFNWTPMIPNPGEEIIFNASDSYDPDGFIKLYEWDWDNDGEYDEVNYSSPIARHTYEEPGHYPVTLRVKDNNFSYSSISRTVRVGNQPPEVPIISGSTRGNVGTDYIYNFTLNDPDDDFLFIMVDWGDNTTIVWDGPYESGKLLTLNHTWYEKGTYTIRVKLKDPWGNESGWGTLTVTMPKSNNIWYSTWLNRFLLLHRFLEVLI